MRNDWFKIKAYPHIGMPFTFNDRPWIERYVTDEKTVASHAFSPFMHRELTTRKFRKQENASGFKSKLRFADKKVRHIYYANHLDAFVYGFYATKLQNQYEQVLNDTKLSECVTAYRSIPISKEGGSVRNKCNIDFADEIFNYIRACTNESLAVIAYDIKNFFDTLDHKHLKRRWRAVIGSGIDLPSDHYNIFKSLTKFSYVNEKEIFREFKERIIVETSSGKVRGRRVDKRKYLRDKNAIAFCDKGELKRLRSKNYIKSNKRIAKDGSFRNKGIPQGTPISAVLANMYMLPFDEACNNFLNEKGIYRRYSDDIIVVCDAEYEDAVKKLIEEEIAKIGLEVQLEKVQTFCLKRVNTIYKCFRKKGAAISDIPSSFDYLGFSFDGDIAYLKSASLAGFYRKMKRAIKRAKFFSLHNKTSARGEIFKSRLYKRFTMRGAQRRKIYKRKPGTTDKWVLTKKYDWGNYLSYAYMAGRIMNKNRIKNQVRRHWTIFHSLLNH